MPWALRDFTFEPCEPNPVAKAKEDGKVVHSWPPWCILTGIRTESVQHRLERQWKMDLRRPRSCDKRIVIYLL